MATRKILIADDDLILAKELETRLQEIGYEVTAIAFSGREAITLTGRTWPHLVLMDMALHGGVSGVEAAEEIRQRWSIPVIFTTADTDDANLQRAKGAEPFGYVAKPFVDRELRINIELALCKHETTRWTRELESRFFTVSIDMLCCLDFDGYFKQLNPAWERTLGFTVPELMSRPFVEFVHPDDRERVLGGLSSAIRTGSDYRCDYRAVTRDGETRWFVLTGRPRRDETGAIVQYAGIVIDVTERTEAAAALEQSNLRFDILAESIPQIVWSTDAEGRHDYFNRRWNEFTGIAPDRIEPTTWQELVHPEDWPRVQQAWQNCLTTGETYDIDYRFRHRDGGYRWLWVLALPLRDAEGRIIRWYGTSSDIDAPKQLDQERELVAHELDHRIKNLFALVNGLVSLSLRELPEHRPLADTLRARLEALNRAHGLIRGERDARCGSLRLLIEQLLAPYRDGYAGRIAIAGEDVTIDAGAVTAVALVFHELITNAAKYGALSRADGSLGITLGADDTLQTIDWQERFEGGIAGEVGEGFGSRLLKAMIEGQLRGTMTSRPSPRGLWLRIDLPRTAFGLTARG